MAKKSASVMKVAQWALGLGLLGLAVGTAGAQTTGPASAISNGDNAWMLVSAALVLMMTGPGLALFYGGLVRAKNVLSTMMHSFILMAVVTVLWAVVTYSLAFGVGSGHFAAFIGGFHNVFLKAQTTFVPFFGAGCTVSFPPMVRAR